MIHNYNIYYFIDNFNKEEIFNLNKKINIIYRNYHQNKIEKTIKEINNFCKITKRKLFISNNLKIALKYNLDGLYLPSFNQMLRYKNINIKKNFKITNKDDLQMFGQIILGEKIKLVGIGFDIHEFKKGDQITLGGSKFKSKY